LNIKPCFVGGMQYALCLVNYVTPNNSIIRCYIS